MLIVCPNCATSYRIEPSSLGASGRSVRCVRCRAVWFARNGPAASDATRASRSDVATPATGPQADTAEPAAPPAAPAGAAASLAETDATAMEHVSTASPPMPEPQRVEAIPSSLVETAGAEALPQPHAPIALADAAPFAPMDAGSEPLPGGAMPGEDIETVAARRFRPTAKRRISWPVPSLPTTIMALLALNAVLIGWRADMVKIAPQMASLYAAVGLPVNLRGLIFANVATTTETHDGVPVLVVEGAIVSAASRATEVPRLRFSVRNQQHQEIYAWTALPSRSLIVPGETLEFRSRLASPPPDAQDILVRFFTRRDLVAGLQ
jgi:predicted Zn finger-like uncharacterized protein